VDPQRGELWQLGVVAVDDVEAVVGAVCSAGEIAVALPAASNARMPRLLHHGASSKIVAVAPIVPCAAISVASLAPPSASS
jgi:hypothetical protein